MKTKILLIILLLISTSAFSQWQRTFGPFGWEVYHLAEGNGYQYASGGILFRSSDNGLTWTEKSSGIGQWDITTIYVSGTRVFAGTDGGNGLGYLYFSDDNGETWLQHNATGNSKNVTGFAKIDNNLFFSSGGSGIFKSTNNGNTWAQVIPSWNPKPSIFTIKNIGNTLFFGELTGLYKSTDLGATWTHCQVNPDNNCEVYSIAVKNTTMFVVYGSCWGYTSSVYRSTDMGASFQPIATSISNAGSVYSDGANVYLGTSDGLWRSTDDGSTWVQLTLAGETVHTALVSANGNIMTGTREHGIFTSTNNGVTWINTGVRNWMMTKALLSIDNTLVTGNDGQRGSILSRDNGNTFTEFNVMDNSYINCLVKRGTDIFAGTTPYVPQKGGIFKSSDYGATWNRIGLADIEVHSITFSPTYLFAGTMYQGVYRTTDDGITWAQAANGLPSNWIRALAYFNNTLYAGTQVGLYSSTNNGSSWTLAGFQNLPVTSLAVFNNKLFAGKEDGVYVLTGLNNWTMTNLTGTIYTLKTLNNKLIAGGIETLSITEDDGNTWSSVWRNLPSGTILDISFNNEYLFVGRGGEGIWRGRINDILSDVEKGDNPISENYYLSQNHPNPFGSSNNRVTKITYQIPLNPDFKNPIILTSSMPRSGGVSGGLDVYVQISVYDILGKEVAKLVNEEKAPGLYEVEFNAAGLPSGVYCYRLTAGSYVNTKKMLLIE